MMFRRLLCILAINFWIFGVILAHDGLHSPSEGGQKFNLEQKISAFEKRLKKNGQDVNALVQLGDLHERLGRISGLHRHFQKATDYFQRILQIDPNHRAALQGWCGAEMARHHFKEALNVARRLSETYPDEITSWLLLGDAHLFLGNYAEANALFQRANNRDQNLATVARMAQMNEFRGKYAESYRLMENALGLAGKQNDGAKHQAWVLTMLGELDLQTNKINEAMNRFQKALSMDEGTHYAKWRTATIYHHMGEYEPARKLLHDLVHAEPRIPYLLAYGDVWQALGRDDRAKHWYRKAENEVIAEMKAGDYGHIRELVAHWSRQGVNLKRTLELASREYEEIRRDAEGAEWLGWLYYLNGEAKAGLPYIERSLRLGTATPRFMLRAALVNHGAGRNIRAAQLLQLGFHQKAFVSKDLMSRAKTLQKWLADHPEALRAEFRVKVAQKPK